MAGVLALWQGVWAWEYYRLGARFAGLGSSFVDGLWQLLPAAWLQGGQAWESLLVLHGQPPLFNALYAALLNTPGPEAWRNGLLAGLYQGLAWHMLWLLYRLLRHWGVSSAQAFVWTLLWGMYPAFAGTWYVFSYTLPVMWALLLLVWAVTAARPGAFGLALVVLAGTRATYALPFALAVNLVVAWRAREHRRWRALRLYGLAALAFAGLWVLKNGWLFGVWAPSSWFGMNWARAYQAWLSPAMWEAGVRQHGWPEGVRVRPFAPITAYPRPLWADAVTAHCPGPVALCAQQRPNGQPNFNFVGYVPVAQAYAQAGVQVVQQHLGKAWAFWRRVALGVYFTPSYYATSAPAAVLRFWQPVTRALDARLCRGQTFDLGQPVPPSWRGYPCPGLAGAHVVVLLTGLGLALAAWRKGQEWWGPTFALGVWLYATMVYTWFEFGENARFRLEVDALFWALTAWALSRALGALRCWASQGLSLKPSLGG